MSLPLSDSLSDDVIINSMAPTAGNDYNEVDSPSYAKATGGIMGLPADGSENGSDMADALQWGYKAKSPFMDKLNRLVPHGGSLSNIYSMCAVTLGSGIFSLPLAFKSCGIATAIVLLVVISLATVYSVYIMAQAVEKTRAIAKREMADKYNLNFHPITPAAKTVTTAPNAGSDACSDERAKAPMSFEPMETSTPYDEVSGETYTDGSKKKNPFRGGLNAGGRGVSTLFLCSYESLSRGLMGIGWDYFAAFNMWFFCFGSCVSYVISVNDLVATTLAPSPGEPLKDGWLFSNEWGSKVLTLVVWAVLMLPLSIPKQINSLRYFSIIGVTFIMYFVIVLIVHSGTNSFYTTEDGQTKLKNKLSAAKTGNQALVGFSTMLFAFLVQTNVLQLEKEALDPSPGAMTRDTAISTAICTTLYILAGFFGYAEFGENLVGTVLRMYNVRSEPAVAVGFIMLGFKLSVSFALCMQPSRDAVYYCMGTHVRTIRYLYHVIIVVFLCVLALILGLAIPDVTIVFSLTGSLSGGFLGFIFPAYFVMYAGNWSLKSVGYFHFISTWLLLISGCIAVVFGTCASIYQMT